MKLWLLRPREDLSKSNDPWEPWFDKAFGFVVRAESPKAARKIANENAKEEKEDASDAWLNPKYSTCKELVREGKPGLIISDIASA